MHTAGVNVVEFHPSDLLLASGSSDRWVVFSCRYTPALCDKGGGVCLRYQTIGLLLKSVSRNSYILKLKVHARQTLLDLVK